MGVLTLALVAGSAGAGWWLMPQPVRGPSARAEPAVERADAQPRTVGLEEDYYVHVKLIELNPQTPDGDSWDARGGAPDIRFALDFNGTRIFTSREADDRLIAEWDLLRLDVKDALLSGQVEVASAVNAPIVRIQPGGILTIHVWDEDVSFNDEAGKLDLPVEMLEQGINVLRPADTGIARIVLDMVRRDMPLPDLLERASNR